MKIDIGWLVLFVLIALALAFFVFVVR